MGLFTTMGGFMAMQFEKRPDGYWYRVDGKGPAWPVTELEYIDFVNRAGISFAMSVAAIMASIIAAAMLISLWFPEGNDLGGFALMMVALVAIGFGLYRAQKWEMRAPERALAGRTPVDLPPIAEAPGDARPVPLTAKPKGGIWSFLGYLVAEIVVGFMTFIGVSWLLRDWSETGSLIVGSIAAIVVVFLIDRLCVRRTGDSVLESLPSWP
ncbi:hypothetical protein ACFQ15_18940 [Sphingomonas hankookensis]|uniref:hypothetical protein n=1 Tax=Sphingomonas hankookensis TaxID=563996 RepID=UPI001F56BC9C|nr:hypothetical protein [Sphingomonas hankookensis]